MHGPLVGRGGETETELKGKGRILILTRQAEERRGVALAVAGLLCFRRFRPPIRRKKPLLLRTLGLLDEFERVVCHYKKMVLTYMSLKSLIAPKCHRAKLSCLTRCSIHFRR